MAAVFRSYLKLIEKHRESFRTAVPDYNRMKGESMNEVELVELHKQLQGSLVHTEQKIYELETLFLEEAAMNSTAE